MAKVLKCGDLMPGCNFVVEGKDVPEVVAKGAEHAKTAHGMTSIPPDVAAKVQAAINEVAEAKSWRTPVHRCLPIEFSWLRQCSGRIA